MFKILSNAHAYFKLALFFYGQVRTFFPRTVAGIQEIIRMAGKEGAKVRASGIRHTTTPWLWGTDGGFQPQSGHSLEYVIAMVPQEGTVYVFYLAFDQTFNFITFTVDVRFPKLIFTFPNLQ